MNKYSKHLKEQTRIDVANNYLKQDIRKRYNLIRDEKTWEQIDLQISNWFNELGIRDYWNGFWGISMGFKLKIQLIQIITAENISWEKQSIPLDEHISSVGYPYISDKLAKNVNAKQLKDFFMNNEPLSKKWKEIFKEHAQSSAPRDSFPLIVTEKKLKNKTTLSVYDGNRRLALALLENKSSLEAYIGRFSSEDFVPKNFWMPTPFLMELVYEGELAGDFDGTLRLLRDVMPLSKSGKEELINRVLIGKNEFRNKLRTELSD